MKKTVFKFDTKTVVTIGIGAALYGALGFIGIPIGPNTQLKPAIALLTIFGALFGPVVGFLMGFIGHALTDMIAGWGVWWGWVMSSAIMGLFMGLVYTRNNFSVKEGSSQKKDIIYMIVTGIIGIVLASAFAGAFDVIVMGEPAKKIIVQIALAMSTNAAVFLVIGVPAVLGFIKVNKKNTNLKMDE